MMYVATVAWSIELVIVATGFVGLYFAGRDRSTHLKTAAWILIVAGVLGVTCNSYYSFRYLQNGYFQSPAGTASNIAAKAVSNS